MPAKKALTKKCRGLWTASNRYDVPEGALVKATNILIRRDGVIEPRWGLTAFATTMASATVNHWHKSAECFDKLFFAGRRTDGASYNIAMGDPTSFAGVSEQVTGEDPPDLSSNFTSTTRLPYFDLEFLKANGNLYYNCFRGLIRIGDTTGAAIRRAGGYPCQIALAPRPISTSLSRSGTTTVTATTAFAHGYTIGVTVVMSSAGSADFGAGTYVIVTVPSSTTFTYVDATATTTATLASQTFAAAQFVGSSGIITTNEQVAYRAHLTEFDVNGVEYIGEVSSRAQVQNAAPAIGAAANKNVQLPVLFGASAPAKNTKLTLYRTKKATTTPGGEFFKVYEKYLTEDDRTRGYLWITDSCPDTLTGEALYTNESQEGELKNNLRPACAKTVALWQDKLVMANTTDYAGIEMQLLSTDSAAGGLASDDRICLDFASASSTTFDAVNSGTALATAYEFVRYSGGTASTDVKNTVLSLIDTINWNSASTPLSTFQAKYTSVGDDWPGRFAVVRVLPDQYDLTSATAKTRVVSTGNNLGRGSATTRGCFAPKLGQIMLPSTTVRAANVVTVTFFDPHAFEVGEYVIVYSSWANQTQLSLAGTAVEGKITSVTATTVVFSNTGSNASGAGEACAVQHMPGYTTKRKKHEVRVSKRRQPEAFPAFSTLEVGQAGANVLKCVPCDESLMVFKEDGLFRVTEDADGVLRAELVDPTAVLWAKDSAVAINGKIMAWLTKGVGIITPAGVEKYASEPIYDKLEPEFFQGRPFTQRAQAFVDEKNGAYELRICMSSGPSAPFASTVNLIYNIFNDTWVEDDLAVVSEVLYKGRRRIQIGTSLYQQPESTYHMGSASVTISGTWTATSTTGFYTTTISAGSAPVGTFILGEDFGSTFIVTAVNGSTLTGYSPDASSAASELSWLAYTPVVADFKYAPITFVEENSLKLFKEAQVLFGLANHYLMYLLTNTELVTTQETLTAPYTSYGSSVTAVEDMQAIKPGNLRVLIPQQHRRGQQLEVEIIIRTVGLPGGVGYWTVAGLGCVADVQDSRISR